MDEELNLPPTAKALVDFIGIRGVLALAEYRGGRWLHVPKNVTQDHPLVEILGWVAAHRLCEAHAGENIKPPMCSTYLRQLRDCEIHRRHYEDGRSLDQLAEEYGLSQSGIVRALARVRNSQVKPSRQSSIF